MSLQVTALEPKTPNETVPYKFNLSPISTFADSSETVSSVAWYVYDDDNDPSSITDLTAMKGTSSSTADTVTCIVTGGTSGKTYILRALVTSTGGSVYEIDGRFSVKANG